MKDILLVTVECLRYDRASLIRPYSDLEKQRGYAVGHYTRPALAGLLSGQYQAALETQVRSPTLAGRLREAGYTTIGVSHSPQTTPGLGFDTGFDTFRHDPSDAEGRGTYWREKLGEFRAVRALHRRIKPKAATLQGVPDDRETVESALDAYRDVSGPTFLWVHLMDTHRPYGRENALAPGLSRRAAGATPGRLSPTLSERETETVRSRYDAAVRRASGHIEQLVTGVADDAVVVVTGDHGEELGQDGYWFHGPYRRRLVDAIAQVPVLSRGVESKAASGHIDIAPTLVNAVGGTPPKAWDGAQFAESDHWLTVAPWAGVTSAAYHTPNQTLRFHDATADAIEQQTVSREAESRLRALGYA